VRSTEQISPRLFLTKIGRPPNFHHKSQGLSQRAPGSAHYFSHHVCTQSPWFTFVCIALFPQELLKDHLVDKHRSLDVGSGSGYLTVCMAKMMKGGFAYGIENPASAAKRAVDNIRKSHCSLLEDGKIMVIQEHNIDSVNEFAPFDSIYIGSSEESFPSDYLKLLKRGGRMVRIP